MSATPDLNLNPDPEDLRQDLMKAVAGGSTACCHSQHNTLLPAIADALDERLGPVNRALDALSGRLDALER